MEGRLRMTKPDGTGTPGHSWWRSAAAVLVPVAVYAVVALLLFRGTDGLGMQFDEVFRLNNLMPVFHNDAQPYDQSISSITVLGVTVPLMYKIYISSAFLAPFLPVGLFADPLSGLRFLYLFYAVAIPSLAFLLFRTRNYWVAFTVPLLALVSPLLYPEITYGFVDLEFMLPLLVAAWLFREYLRRDRAWRLFIVALLVGVSVNMAIYAAWIVLGLGVAGVLLYRRSFWRIVVRWRHLAALVSGLALGLLNYVYYNLTAGFPTVTPMFNRLFRPAVYAENTIDYKEPIGIVDEMISDLRYARTLLGPHAGVFLAILVAAALVTVVCAFVAARRGRFDEIRLHLVPIVALVVAFALILISPNTTRRGHYAVLVGLVELSLVCAFLLALRFVPRVHVTQQRVIAGALALSIFTFAGTTSRHAVDAVIRTGGDGFFSSAIFDLRDYLQEEGTPATAVLQAQWGSGAQLYFLSKGTYAPPSVVGEVLGSPDLASRAAVVAAAIEASGGTSLIPVYTNASPPAGIDVTEVLEAVASDEAGSVCTVEIFRDHLGGEEIRLYRVSLEPGSENSTDASEECAGIP